MPASRRLLAWLVLLGVVGLVLLTGGPASAHATLVDSDPAEGAVLAEAPRTISLTYDETIKVGAVPSEVFDPAGIPLPVTQSATDATLTISLPPDLGEGSYVVYWRIISASDGHPIAGISTFSVGAATAIGDLPELAQEPPTSTSGVLAGLSVLATGGLLVAGGVTLFASWLPVVAPPRLWRTADVAGAVAVLASAALVPVAGVYQQGLGLSQVATPEALDPELVTGRVAVLGLVAVGLLVARIARGRAVLVTVATVAAVAAPALVGHTRAYGPTFAMVLGDATHLLAGAVWLGGLVALLLLGRAVTVEVARRWAAWALVAVAVVAVAGLLLAWQILGSWSLLLQIAWGRLLLAKVALVAVAVALGAWQRRVWIPRGAPPRRLLAAEIAVLAVVVGVAGVLVDEPPIEVTKSSLPGGQASPSQAPAAEAESPVGDYVVSVSFDPGTRGANQMTVRLTRDGEPVTGVLPTVALLHPAYDLGELPLTERGPGEWRDLVLLPIHGQWSVLVIVDDDAVDLSVAIAPSA